MEDDIRSLFLWSKQAKTGGFGRARRSELKRIIEAHTDVGDRRRAILGFATQYVYEYLLPRSVRDWIWRRNVSGGNAMFGLNVSGDIEKCAVFDLFHYDRLPKTSINLRTRLNSHSFRIGVDGAEASLHTSQNGLLVYKMPKQLPAGECARIEVQSATDSPIHISGIQLR